MLREDEAYIKNEIESANGMPEITDAIARIWEYLGKEYYPSKTQRLKEWDPTEQEIYELVISIFTAVLVNGSLTYQALMGMLNYKIELDDVIDRVKILAEITAIISRTGLIDITKRGSGRYILISTEFQLDSDIPFVDKHGTVYHRAQPVEFNWDPEQGSMLLGGKMNHHEGNVCLDHINRMNKIPLTLNKEFLFKYKEEHKDTFIKKTDSDWNIIQKEKMWDQYVDNAKWKYIEALARDKNRIFINHKYCTRGRTYGVGYYINYQGSSFKKGSLQLVNKEYLNEE